MIISNGFDKLAFVKAQCHSIKGAVHHDSYTMVRCPYHDDKNPSGCISHSNLRYAGMFKCFGCGKTASWNEVAPMLGCEPFQAKPVPVFMPVQSEKDDEGTSENLIFSPIPSGKRWRTISTDLLKAIGCRICRINYGYTTSERFIYMPVLIDNELHGYVKARMHRVEGKPSYVNKAGTWVRQYGLFPFDYSLSMNSKIVVLVEGQRDSLRLVSLGIPAMCIMGTQNWSDQKSRLLELHGIEMAYIMMDGDEAGINGTEKVYASLSRYIKCKVIRLWNMKGSPYLEHGKHSKLEMWDPGNCPLPILYKLKERINAYKGN